MKFASAVILCTIGFSLAGCASTPANSGSVNDPGSFKGDLNTLGGPALNAPDVNAPNPTAAP